MHIALSRRAPSCAISSWVSSRSVSSLASFRCACTRTGLPRPEVDAELLSRARLKDPESSCAHGAGGLGRQRRSQAVHLPLRERCEDSTVAAVRSALANTVQAHEWADALQSLGGSCAVTRKLLCHNRGAHTAREPMVDSDAALSSESAAPALAADAPRNSRRFSQPLAALRRGSFCCTSAHLHAHRELNT